MKELRYMTGAPHALSRMSAQMFVLGGKKGYDSDAFAEIILNSKRAPYVYDDILDDEWASPAYILEGYEREYIFKKGKVYNEDILFYAGYLYRYWVIKEDRPIKEIYNIVHLSYIADMYGFYHTQSFDYVIDVIKEAYKAKGKTLI